MSFPDSDPLEPALHVRGAVRLFQRMLEIFIAARPSAIRNSLPQHDSASGMLHLQTHGF